MVVVLHEVRKKHLEVLGRLLQRRTVVGRFAFQSQYLRVLQRCGCLFMLVLVGMDLVGFGFDDWLEDFLA